MRELNPSLIFYEESWRKDSMYEQKKKLMQQMLDQARTDPDPWYGYLDDEDDYGS